MHGQQNVKSWKACYTNASYFKKAAIFILQMYTGFWRDNLQREDSVGDPLVDRRVLLKWILNTWDSTLWNYWAGL